MITSVLGAGPMSSEIVRACVKFSHDTGEEIMLIASLNQVNRFGGYVEGWRTHDFVLYVVELEAEYPNARIVLCRDHLGPGFCPRVGLEEIEYTIEDDIACGMDLIHLDMCHLPEEHKLPITLECVRRCAGRVELEVGTDENTGKVPHGQGDLRRLLDAVCEIQRPVFVVKQTGSLVREDRQAGRFQRPKVKRIVDVLGEYAVRLKEHNADYLSLPEIQRRAGLVGAVNIAPQLGSLQSRSLTAFGQSTLAFARTCLARGDWKKWVDKPIEEYLPSQLISICGHYNFQTPEYRELVDSIGRGNFETLVDKLVRATLSQYIQGLRYDPNHNL